MAKESDNGQRPARDDEHADDESAYERFETLTKQLLVVPKHAIDAAREAVKNGRGR